MKRATASPDLICGQIWKDTIPSSCPPGIEDPPHGPKYARIPYHAVWVVFDIRGKELWTVIVFESPCFANPGNKVEHLPVTLQFW